MSKGMENDGVRYVAEITRITDRVTRTFDEDWMEWHEATEYLWTDGNFGCDCNRERFFAYAGGEESPDTWCSDERFDVRLVAKVDGRVLYDDAASKWGTE